MGAWSSGAKPTAKDAALVAALLTQEPGLALGALVPRRRSSADECRGRVGARRSVAGGGGSHAGGRHLSSRSGDRAAGTAARTLSTAVVQLAAGDPYRYATGGSSVGGGWRRRIELPLSSNRWA